MIPVLVGIAPFAMILAVLAVKTGLSASVVQAMSYIHFDHSRGNNSTLFG
jgi:predicted branched-subunit amino acid permease